MKKVSMMLAAVAMLAACAKTENLSVDNGVSPISFDYTVVNPTKALYTGVDKVDKFNVTAIQTAPGAPSVFFENKEVTVSNVGGVYKGTMADKYYWGQDMQLSFYAYAPAATVNPQAAISVAAKKITYTSATDQNSVKNETVTDIIVASKSTVEVDEVPLNFVHALSQIEVQAKNTTASYTVKVAGVKLIGFNSKGTFTYPVADITGVASIENTWSDQSTLLAYPRIDKTLPFDLTGQNVATSGVVTLDGDAKNIHIGSSNFMVIPQTTTESSYIAVLVNVRNSGGSQSTIYPVKAGSESKYAYVRVKINGKTFAPGKKYVVTLDFSNGIGKPVPTEYAKVGTPYTNDPSDVDTTQQTADPDKPILGKEIKFSVQLAEWENDNTNNINM